MYCRVTLFFVSKPFVTILTNIVAAQILQGKHMQKVHIVSPKNPPPIGGLLYVIAGLLLLGCLGGIMQLFQFVLGTENSVAPDAFGASVQAVTYGVTLSLYVWSTRLFFKKSKRFKMWFAISLVVNCVSGAVLLFVIEQNPDTVKQQEEMLMFTSLIYMVLIYYLYTAKRVANTFIAE